MIKSFGRCQESITNHSPWAGDILGQFQSIGFLCFYIQQYSSLVTEGKFLTSKTSQYGSGDITDNDIYTKKYHHNLPDIVKRTTK